jgi:hypothetical protein
MILNVLSTRIKLLMFHAWWRYQQRDGWPTARSNHKDAMLHQLAWICSLLHQLAIVHCEQEQKSLIGWTARTQADNSLVYGAENAFERDMRAFILVRVEVDLLRALLYDRGSVMRVLVGMHNTSLWYIKDLKEQPASVVTPEIEQQVVQHLAPFETL